MGRFHASSAFHRHVAGPIGSGKTTAAAPWEAVLTAMQQKPDSNGVRFCKIGVLRDTYRNVYRSLIPTWNKVFPRDLGKFVGSDDRPAMHHLRFPAPLLDRLGQPTRQVGMCELQTEFLALGTNTVEAVCRGWETMGAYLDEEDLLPPEARSFLAGRAQRGGDARYRVSRGVWGCFNKPDIDHPLYLTCVEAPPPGWEFFDQPPGLLPGGPPYITNPDAENLRWLDPSYYPLSADGQPEWYVRRMLRNQWGASVAGEPVYPMFSRERHVLSAELEPPDGAELALAADGGGTPAAVVGGRTETGRRIIYAEIVLIDPSDKRRMRLLHGVGPRRFAEAIADAIWPRFRHCRITMAYGDPAAFYGADREMGEYSFMEVVGNHLGIAMMPAPSNEIDLRIEAVRTPLSRLNRYDGQPDLMVNPSCRHLIRGFTSDYKWEAVDPKQPGKRLKPQKSATSHVHDAGQYFALGDQGRAAVVAGPKYDRFQPAAAPSSEFADASRNIWREHEQRAAGERGGNSYSADFDLWRS
jgi:hypothetical protein